MLLLYDRWHATIPVLDSLIDPNAALGNICYANSPCLTVTLVCQRRGRGVALSHLMGATLCGSVFNWLLSAAIALSPLWLVFRFSHGAAGSRGIPVTQEGDALWWVCAIKCHQTNCSCLLYSWLFHTGQSFAKYRKCFFNRGSTALLKRHILSRTHPSSSVSACHYSCTMEMSSGYTITFTVQCIKRTSQPVPGSFRWDSTQLRRLQHTIALVFPGAVMQDFLCQIDANFNACYLEKQLICVSWKARDKSFKWQLQCLSRGACILSADESQI